MSLGSKDIALTGMFASLYAVLSAIPLFPVIGVGGKFFTVAVVIAPLMGLIIGPYRGALAASLGGFIAWSITQFGPLFVLSFAPGTATALCSGSLYNGKWKTFVLMYTVLLLTFGFYPVIGPLWLFPYYVWFHLFGLVVLLSQVKPKATGALRKYGEMLQLSFQVGVVSFIATLFGHLVGGLIYNWIYFPTFYSQVEYWRGLWQTIVFLYPLERSIVVLISVLIGAPLIKALRVHGFEIGGK